MAGLRPRWEAIARRAVTSSFIGLAGVYASIGAWWTWLNLSTQPPYPDSVRYRWFSESLTVDHFHGGLYPLVLHFVQPWDGNAERLQLLQFGVLALCLAYLLRSLGCLNFAFQRFGRTGLIALFGAFLLLLVSDPLLSHFALSLMPDSLALSGCLLFTAALLDLNRAERNPAFAAAALLAGFVLAAGVRIEKSWVLFATLGATLFLWLLATRGPRPLFGHWLRTRSGVAIAVAIAGFASVEWLHASMYREPPKRIAQGLRLSPWSATTTVLHHRIIFPNLESVYPELSPASRAILTLRDARIYDRKIHNTWAVTDRVTRRDPGVRDQLTRDLASAALRGRWPSIAADIASDTAENLLVPVSFYLRLMAWSFAGADPEAFGQRFEATAWTYDVLARNYPGISRLFLAVSGLFFVFAAGLALLHLRTRVCAGSWRPTAQTALTLAPILLLATANAFAFSLSADLVNVRYTLFAHTTLLILVYRGALGWVLEDSRRNPSLP